MSESIRSYTAVVDRGEKFWLIYVPEIDKTTQARNLHEAEEMARDLIAIIEEISPESINVRITFGGQEDK